MPSFKPAIRSGEINSDGKSNIKIRVSHEGKVRYIKTPYYIEAKYLLDDGKVNEDYPKSGSLNTALLKIHLEYQEEVARIGTAIRNMDINTLVNRLRGYEPEGASLIKYIENRINTLKKEKRHSYIGTFDSTIKWLKKFTGKSDILFKEVNRDFLERFEAYLIEKGKKVNTRRIYLNCIKVSFNHAIDHDKIRMELYPFRKFRVRSEKPERPALTLEEIKKLQEPASFAGQRVAIDMWMLSFYLIGMNCKDMLYLTSKNIRRDRIIYKRAKIERKVEEMISVKIQPEARKLLEKYKGEKYLLAFLDTNDTYIHFKTISHNFNTRLKFFARKHGIDENISMGYVRHSWATIASNLDISEDTISHALGHERNKITSGYITYDITQVDEANEMIIKAVS